MTLRVWLYCAVTLLTNTVVMEYELFSTPIVPELLFQVTVVAGPPVEIHVMVNQGMIAMKSFSVSDISPFKLPIL